MEWKYVKKLRDENVVIDFLKRYNITLPKSLLNCLMQYNGGRPESKLFDTNKMKEYVFKALLSYNEEDIESIYKVYPGKFVGTTLYPIATDSSGNFICYDVKQEKYVLWKHESNKKEDIISGEMFQQMEG